MDLPNPDRQLKPAMLAIDAAAGPRRSSELVIPAAAVVREEQPATTSSSQTAPDTFLLRPVTLGAEYGGQRVLIGGMRDGREDRRRRRLPPEQRAQARGAAGRLADVESLVHARRSQQRIVVVVLAVVLLAFGIDATRKLSVDAFPDVTNIQVQVATEAPGRSPEEVERFVTVPIEIGMTGLPGLTEMRSLNKPGLSLITLVFTDEHRRLLRAAAGDGAADGGRAPAAGGHRRRCSGRCRPRWARSTSTRSNARTTASAR